MLEIVATRNDDRVFVTAQVKFVLPRLDITLFNPNSVDIKLEATLYGADDFLKFEDDILFRFQEQKITNITGGTYVFQEVLSFGMLNEDSFLNNEDEIYVNFTLLSNTQGLPLNVSINSPNLKLSSEWGSLL